jgi:hypothetical protein
MGHDLTLFSYEPAQLRREGLPVRIEDARDVLSDASLGPLRQNKPDHFSDHFRLEGLSQGRGIWTDLDLVFMRPLPSDDLVFGWESDSSINGAVLRFPAASEAQADYLALCRQRPVSPIAPWWPMQKKFKRSLKILSKKLRNRPVLANHYGPEALTHFACKYGLASHASPQDVYYPVPPPWPGTTHYSEAEGVDRYITTRTKSVHLWHSLYRRMYGTDLPRSDTWLGRKCQEYGIGGG